MDRNFGGVIWTNHALSRLRDRNISQSDAWYAFRRPQQSRYAEAKQAWIYYRDYENVRIEVVAKQNEKKEWLIISVWSNQNNYQKPQQKSNSFLKLIKWLFS